MKRCLVLLSLLLSPQLSSSSEQEGCSISVLLETPKNSIFKNQNEKNCTEEITENVSTLTLKTRISEDLMFVKVMHESKEVFIEREILKNEFSCPPFCIEAINIKDVTTVAELEVLAFIDKLKEKKARLLIDVRENSLYAKGTIPGAINLPFSMLQNGSEYQEEVLLLLGAKLKKNKSKSKWSFTNAQSLLIFGSSATSAEASNSVKKLLALGYPSSKLYYYRAGLSSWKALGLTVY